MEETYNVRLVDDTLATRACRRKTSCARSRQAGLRSSTWRSTTKTDIVRSLGMTWVHIPVVFAGDTEADL